MTLNNDSAFFVQETSTGAIIDQFDTFQEALDAIKEYNDTDKEEGTYTPDFYEGKHGTMLYDERGNAKNEHEITDRIFTKGSYGTGDHLSYFADGIEYEVQGEFYIQDDGTPQHTHIFPDGIEMEVYPYVTDRQRIGKRIAQLRTEAGMSQARLAELTGMEQPHIARIEAGRYSVGVDILGKIAAALGKRVDIVD